MGPAFLGFLEKVVPEEARDAIRSSSVQVLQRALEAGPGATGLVVGRVQSGKTLSYEGVASLARDNGFGLVVVISGISNPLLAQGERRLRGDLSVAESDGWIFISPAESQQVPGAVRNQLAAVCENWRDPDTPPAYKKSAVVFLLKYHGRLAAFANDCASLDMSGVRVLVIDDEADQASLNAQAKKNKETTTYATLRMLREALPSHYYLQYTATPQAPLLISIQDTLSPKYVCVLEPGDGYVGGETYFGPGNDRIVISISDEDLLAAEDAAGPPPTSLRRAFMEFLVGAAHVAATGKPSIRSMLVHPSRETLGHGAFTYWLRMLYDDWRDKLSHQEEAPPEKLKAEFSAAWKSLAETFPEIRPIDECWASLKFVLRNLEINEINTRMGETPVVQWEKTKSYVLVGGQAIDRGFTVEGLTVTYMPRGTGTWTADTIQQRARFFGYKSDYLGLCRVYLEPQVLDAFRNYVQHERDMLSSLREIAAGAESLPEWRRKFLLDPRFKPTRAAVIGIATARVKTSDRWIADRFPVREDAREPEKVWVAIDELRTSDWVRTRYGHERTSVAAHQALVLLEQTAPPSLLGERLFHALSLSLARLADDEPDAEVAVVRMRPGQASYRSEREDGSVQVFQGRTPASAREGGYPGDRAVFEPSARITVQFHHFEVRALATGTPLAAAVTSAWRVPESSPSGWLIQVGN